MGDKVNNAEERRVRWTTYFNIKSWFDNRENDLVKLGFASANDKDIVAIPNEQLKCTIHIDETCLVMDGSKCNCGTALSNFLFSQSTKSQKINNQVKCINDNDYGQYSSGRSNSATFLIFY